MSDIESRVKMVLSQQLGLDMKGIRNEQEFLRDLGADSLDFPQWVIALEAEFSIEISDEEAYEIISVQHAIDVVKRQIG
ncbi:MULTISPECIES: acyl carrier protein [unclassified Pseudomonas]|uniref:acyl carrier protein n=1 Tax=unclassified Pseudomonas TaxID=196821 RepID=UPI0030DA9920